MKKESDDRKKAFNSLIFLFVFYSMIPPSIFFWSLVGLDKVWEKLLSPTDRMAISHLLLTAITFSLISLLPSGPKNWGVNLQNWRRSLILGIVFGVGFGIIFSIFSFGFRLSEWEFSHMLEKLHVRENLVQLFSQLFLVGLSEEFYFRGILLISLYRFFSKKNDGNSFSGYDCFSWLCLCPILQADFRGIFY